MNSWRKMQRNISKWEKTIPKEPDLYGEEKRHWSETFDIDKLIWKPYKEGIEGGNVFFSSTNPKELYLLLKEFFKNEDLD